MMMMMMMMQMMMVMAMFYVVLVELREPHVETAAPYVAHNVEDRKGRHLAAGPSHM